MDERRSERFSISLTPDMRATLDAYAARHRWTRSTAAANLIESGLERDRDRRLDEVASESERSHW